MCRICGRIVTKGGGDEVVMAGRTHTVCSSCADKKIPMLTPVPSR